MASQVVVAGVCVCTRFKRLGHADANACVAATGTQTIMAFVCLCANGIDQLQLRPVATPRYGDVQQRELLF